MTEQEEQELTAAFEKEFAALRAHQDTVTVEMSMIQAWCLLAQVQLASRHPQNNGFTLEIAAEAMAHICKAMPFGPAMRRVANLGWSSEHDKPARPV